MASPHVAGAVALLIEHGGANPAGIRQALQSSANSPYSGFNSQLGWGEIDVYEALVAYAPVDKPPTAKATANPSNIPRMSSGAVPKSPRCIQSIIPPLPQALASNSASRSGR